MHVNAYGGVYADEIKALQRDCDDILETVVQSAEKAIGGGRSLKLRGCYAPSIFFLCLLSMMEK